MSEVDVPRDEFSLIRTFVDAALRRDDVRAGIGDDAALLAPAPGMELVVTTDMLLAGVHFPDDLTPADIGYRALAVNLSDLAAMGAKPAWATLALALPEDDEAWLQAFAGGLFALAHEFDVALVGGDTVRGPLGISITALGQVPAGTALRRGGARPGDAVAVSGPLGLAALALHCRQSGAPVPPPAAAKLARPWPRVHLGERLRGHASACIDLSDGLAGDLGHILAASHCGATLEAAALPLAGAACGAEPAQRLALALHGGDDYELCFTCEAAWLARAAARDAELARCRRIGTIEAAPGLRLRDATGHTREVEARGYRHF